MTTPVRRAVIILGIVVLCLVVYGVALTMSNRHARKAEFSFERQIIANCLQLNKAHHRFNGMLDQLSRNARHIAGFTPKQRKEALTAYHRLHLPYLPCPPTS